MQQQITVAVLGGTGKAGKYLVKHLLDQQYQIHLLVRKPADESRFDNPLIRIIRGDASDPEVIRRLVKGCDAVVSAIGQLKDEPMISSLATANIIAAMAEYGVKRYILITGLTMDAPDDNKSRHNRELSAYMQKMYSEVVADKQNILNLLAASQTDWTIVRLPVIAQTDERKQLAVSTEDCPGGTIGTADLADFLVGQLTSGTYIKRCPFIASL